MEDSDIELAIRAARAHAAAAASVTRLVEHLTPPAGPADIAEYANLLAREKATHEERTAAMHAVGLAVPSIDDDAD